MISFITHNYLFFKRKEVWFHENEEIKNTGYTVYIAAYHPPGENDLYTHTQTTSCVNLLDSTDSLLKAIHKGTRYDIRMGEKENLNFKYHFSNDQLDYQHLIEEYTSFASQKKIKILSKKWLLVLKKCNKLCITKISEGPTDISTHIYLYDDSKVILTHSFHNINYKDQILRGYANKFLHWKDILLFKERGFSIYDFGGVNPSLQGISDFKTRFGGEITNNYSYIKTNLFFRTLAKSYKFIFRK
jgi:lipid II:glycine glycyltransferase (peptidoglycan interpeptide bridge formation enzyme)